GVEKIYGTAWSPPAWMKTGGTIESGKLKKECYQDYADYLAQYVKIYRDVHGVNMYGVSFANEPEIPMEWKCCSWTGAEIRDFLVNYLHPTFLRENLTTNIMGPETGMWSELWMNDTLNDPAGVEALDIVTCHQYQGLITKLSNVTAKGKQLWMSELCDTKGSYHVEIDDAVGWAAIIHKFMTVPEVNAFLYWRGAHNTNSNETLIRIDSSTSYTVPKRLYALGHYSRFVRPGYVRIGATEKPYSGLDVSAYKDPETGEFSIVLVNEDKENNRVLDFNLQDFTAGFVTPYLTDLNYNMEQLEDIPVTNGRFSVSLGACSMMTLTGKAGSSPIAPKTYAITDPLDNMSMIYSKTNGWTIEAGNDYGRYDRDASCIRRTQTGAQSIVYRYSSIQDFLATIYTCDDLNGISFYSSVDGVQYQPIELAHTKPVYTTKDWSRVQYYPTQALPVTTNFLKVEFSGGSNAWNKHLAELSLSCNPNGFLLQDSLKDLSQVYSSTNMEIGGLDGSQKEKFDNDISRAVRTTKNDGELIYHVDGKTIGDFDVRLYYYDNFDDRFKGMSFYSSTDGTQWTPLAATTAMDYPTRDYWHKVSYRPLIKNAGISYLKIKLSEGRFNWNKQVAEVTLYES
ncbi:MAG: hypothetical protein RR444_05645, partial [Oscillospiraceae bacterium]